MNFQNPRVSVVMSAYNAEKYLCEAVDSILTQTFTDFEFIIIDDGSTDATSHILDGYFDPRIIRKRNQQNLGYTPSLNWGIANAEGELIARMDADDISLPDRFATQVDFLDCHPSITVIGTGFRKMDETGKCTSADILPPDNPNYVKWLLYFQNILCHPSVMFRRNVFTQSGGYDPVFMPAEDYEIWQRLSQQVKLSNVRKALIQYRKHGSNISKTQSNLQKECDLQISRRGLSSLTEQQVTMDDVRGLRNLSHENPHRYLKLVRLSLDRFVKNNFLTANETKLIRQDAASRMFAIADHHWRDGLSRRYLLTACFMNPSLMNNLFNSFMRRAKVSAAEG